MTFTYYLWLLKLKSLFFQKGLALFFVAIAAFFKIYQIIKLKILKLILAFFLQILRHLQNFC